MQCHVVVTLFFMFVQSGQTVSHVVITTFGAKRNVGFYTWSRGVGPALPLQDLTANIRRGVYSVTHNFLTFARWHNFGWIVQIGRLLKEY